MKLLNGYAAIKREESETKTQGGIVLANEVHPDRGTVVALSEHSLNTKGNPVPWDIQVGDKVVFGQFSGLTVKVEEEELLLMKEGEIFAVVD